MGRHCFTTTVKPGKLEEYIKMHDNIYPEVAAGLRACGVTQLTIFLQPGNPARLIMYIETAGDIDLALATGPGSRYRQEPRCREWEGQTCVAAVVARMSHSLPHRAELMDADFHFGWTPVRVQRCCPFIAARH